MINLTDVLEGAEIFKALGSDVRLRIVARLASRGDQTLDELSRFLDISKAALSPHVRKLREAELIEIIYGGDGGRSHIICRLSHNALHVDFKHDIIRDYSYDVELDVGLYFDYSIRPICGIATRDHLIGCYDEPRYFTHPERVNAAVLWFASGYAEYKIPNFLKPGQVVRELVLTFEVRADYFREKRESCSDILLTLNGLDLGSCTNPVDLGLSGQLLTPDWWPPDWSQFGLLRELVINKGGIFLDGQRISDRNIDDLELDHGSDMTFRLSVLRSRYRTGGMTLFGKGFGRYDQGIRSTVRWMNSPDPSPVRYSR